MMYFFLLTVGFLILDMQSSDVYVCVMVHSMSPWMRGLTGRPSEVLTFKEQRREQGDYKGHCKKRTTLTTHQMKLPPIDALETEVRKKDSLKATFAPSTGPANFFLQSKNCVIFIPAAHFHSAFTCHLN